MDFVRIWKENYKKIKPVPAKFAKKSPLFDNVYRDGDIDMFKFPTPKWHDKDGGRYIGTGSVDITRDPDEGWRDWVEWEGRADVQELAAHIEELLDEEPDFWDSEWCANLAAAKLELPFRFREALFQP